MKDKKLGKIIIDGKIIDLDNIPLDDLKSMQEEISKKEDEKREEIEKLLQDMKK